MGRASDPSERKREEKFEASQRAAGRLLERYGTRLEQLDRWIDDPPDGDTHVSEVRFKMGGGFDGGVLAMIKAVRGGEPFIAFHGAESLGECLTGLVTRMDNGTLKWREDVPYGER